MPNHWLRLRSLIWNSIYYSSISIVLSAALLMLIKTAIFSDITDYRFMMLPDTALALLAMVVLLYGAVSHQRSLSVTGLLATLAIAIAGLVWHQPYLATSAHGWLGHYNRVPLWQSITLLLLCLPWCLGMFSEAKAGLFRLLCSLFVIAICSAVLLVQTGVFSAFAISFSVFSLNNAASTYSALLLIMLAMANLAAPYIKLRRRIDQLHRMGWLLACIIGLMTTLLWFNFAYQLQSNVRQSSVRLAERLQLNMDELVAEQRNLLIRLAERIIATDTELTQAYFEVAFQSFLRDFPYIDYMAVQGPDGQLQYTMAQSQTELVRFDQFLQQQDLFALQPTAKQSEPGFNLRYDNQNDHAFLIVTLPPGNQAGVTQLVASVDFSKGLIQNLPGIVPAGYFIKLVQTEHQSTLYDTVAEIPDTTHVGLFGVNLEADLRWQLRVYTNLKTDSSSNLVTAEIMLVTGWLATLLLVLSKKLYSQSRRNRIRLQVSNSKLRNNINKLNKLQLQQLQIMTNSADMICVINAKGQFVEVSASCQRILGYRVDELVGEAFIGFVHPDDKIMTESEARQIISSGKLTTNFRNRYLHKDNHTVHLMWVANYVHSQGLLYAIGRDVNDIVEAEQQLRLFKRAVDATANGVIIVDLAESDQPVSYVNTAFEKLTGYSAAEIIGKNCRFLQGAEPDFVAVNQMRHAIEQREECSVVLKNYRKDHSLFWNQLFLAPVPDDSGEISHYIGVQTDITPQKRFEDELAYNASHDLLTGLPNRALLRDRLSQSYQINQRNQKKIAILFIDLDGFKVINDSLGHLTGDEVLKNVSQQISSCIRPGDTLARIGGDEFVVLLTELVDPAEIAPIAERLLLSISQPMHVSGQELHISASIGISISDNQLLEPMHLVQQADLAMYLAKQLGRNNFQWYSKELEVASGKQLSLRAQLKKAIANEEFELYYQPQIDAVSGDVIGLEALLRWQHSELGFISPEEFIPLAESTGEIVPLSNWVFNKASQYNQSLIERGIASVVMAVNVSSVHFSRSNFVGDLQHIVEQNGLAAKWFEIELTESLLFDNIEQVILKLQQVRQLGIKVSIDDFGTGYSSLSYLKRLPIDKLKIDRAFIKDIVSDKRDAAISKAIIGLAHHLDIRVIAEGVENEAQAALLRKSLCDEYQGFYFAKPMPAAELELYLQSYQQNRVIRPEVVSGGKTILLVDDEENILSALTRLFRREGYQILCCTTAMQAFKVLALNDVQVIVSDQRMPGISGTEFLSQIKDMYPDTIRIMLSGYTDLRSVTEAINKGAIYKFMTKPWQDDELRQEIKRAFAQHQQQLSSKTTAL